MVSTTVLHNFRGDIFSSSFLAEKTHHSHSHGSHDHFTRTLPVDKAPVATVNSASWFNVKKICTAAGAVIGAAAGFFLLGPVMAGAAGLIGGALGAASGILTGSTLGGIIGGHVGTFTGMKMNKKYLATAGLALGIGLGFAALGGVAGGYAGPVVGRAIAKAGAYFASTLLGTGTGALLGHSCAPQGRAHSPQKAA